MTLTIYLDNEDKGPQMFAEFEFGVLNGIFRFERQEGDQANLKPTVPKKPQNLLLTTQFGDTDGVAWARDDTARDWV